MSHSRSAELGTIGVAAEALPRQGPRGGVTLTKSMSAARSRDEGHWLQVAGSQLLLSDSMRPPSRGRQREGLLDPDVTADQAQIGIDAWRASRGAFLRSPDLADQETWIDREMCFRRHFSGNTPASATTSG